MFKPKKTDGSFAGRRNNYLEYISKEDYYENLSPGEYLDMIRPYLEGLINEQTGVFLLKILKKQALCIHQVKIQKFL